MDDLVPRFPCLSEALASSRNFGRGRDDDDDGALQSARTGPFFSSSYSGAIPPFLQKFHMRGTTTGCRVHRRVTPGLWNDYQETRHSE